MRKLKIYYIAALLSAIQSKEIMAVDSIHAVSQENSPSPWAEESKALTQLDSSKKTMKNFMEEIENCKKKASQAVKQALHFRNTQNYQLVVPNCFKNLFSFLDIGKEFEEFLRNLYKKESTGAFDQGLYEKAKKNIINNISAALSNEKNKISSCNQNNALFAEDYLSKKFDALQSEINSLIENLSVGPLGNKNPGDEFSASAKIALEAIDSSLDKLLPLAKQLQEMLHKSYETIESSIKKMQDLEEKKQKYSNNTIDQGETSYNATEEESKEEVESGNTKNQGKTPYEGGISKHQGETSYYSSEDGDSLESNSLRLLWQGGETPGNPHGESMYGETPQGETQNQGENHYEEGITKHQGETPQGETQNQGENHYEEGTTEHQGETSYNPPEEESKEENFKSKSDDGLSHKEPRQYSMDEIEDSMRAKKHPSLIMLESYVLKINRAIENLENDKGSDIVNKHDAFKKNKKIFLKMNLKTNSDAAMSQYLDIYEANLIKSALFEELKNISKFNFYNLTKDIEIDKDLDRKIQNCLAKEDSVIKSISPYNIDMTISQGGLNPKEAFSSYTQNILGNLRDFKSALNQTIQEIHKKISKDMEGFQGDFQ